MNYNLPKFPFNVPFFMFDIDNKQLISTRFVPSDIRDTKDIVLVENPVPGLNYQPITQGGGGNRKLAFTLPLVKRNNTVGNVLMLKTFDMLRQQVVGIFNFKFSTGQFTSYPRVLFYYGVGSVPLIYRVKKCDPTHKQGWTNELGFPQYSELDIELWLDENNFIYKAEEVFRKISAITGSVIGLYEIAKGDKNKRDY